jgi:DNA (cytosine-5)-methyltransferase 1
MRGLGCYSRVTIDNRPTFYEFFAGGGMARAGLGDAWRCLVANDFDAGKAKSYIANWGDEDFRLGDIATLSAADLPGRADLAWASFPCQDLSLAGHGKGLAGERSGTFWAFWRLMNSLRQEGRQPRIIALENVVGLLTSNKGADFVEIIRSLVALDYRVGAMAIDAERFLPQSRPRLFIVAVDRRMRLPGNLAAGEATPWTTPSALSKAMQRAVETAREHLVWWRLREPPMRNLSLADIIDHQPSGVEWHPPEQTDYLLSLMSPLNRAKLEAARLLGGKSVGTIYRRTRPNGEGGKAQRAELRLDGVAGCLRTPAGGSSRQIVIVIEDGAIRTRLLSPREAARLMGLPEHYRLPARYNEAYRLVGDGVAADVASYLARELFGPLLGVKGAAEPAAA